VLWLQAAEHLISISSNLNFCPFCSWNHPSSDTLCAGCGARIAVSPCRKWPPQTPETVGSGSYIKLARNVSVRDSNRTSTIGRFNKTFRSTTPRKQAVSKSSFAERGIYCWTHQIEKFSWARAEAVWAPMQNLPTAPAVRTRHISRIRKRPQIYLVDKSGCLFKSCLL
jgi:hypothetical protein